MAKSNQVRFNIKNLKYAVKTDGTYEAPVDLAYANSLALEADFDTTKIYGDGQKLGEIIDDKGKTGTLSVNEINEEYEIACGRQMLVDGGNAVEVQQVNSMSHAIYYEVDWYDNGVLKTIKTWLLNCVTAPANESYEQTTDNPTINTIDYPLTVFGDRLLTNDGASDYVDGNGQTKNVTRVFSFPDDTDYDTFQAAVPVPKEVAAA